MADKLGQELIAAVIGDDRFEGLEGLCHHGADRVVKCAHPMLKVFSTDGFCAVLSTLIAGIKPAAALYGATPNGRELAPRVAARLRLGLTADCTLLDIDDQGQLVQTRPAFGGNIMASIIAPRVKASNGHGPAQRFPGRRGRPGTSGKDRGLSGDPEQGRYPDQGGGGGQARRRGRTESGGSQAHCGRGTRLPGRIGSGMHP